MNKAEKTQKFIVESAAPIFNKKGYDGASISDILEVTGLTKGSIYGNFENKDALALAALEYNLKLTSEGVHKFINLKDNSVDKLIAHVEFYRKFFHLTVKIGGCPVANAAVDSDDGNPLIKKRVLRFIRDWKKQLINIIETGKNNGELRSDFDPETFSMLFITMIEGGLLLSKATDDKQYLDNIIEHIKSLIESARGE